MSICKNLDGIWDSRVTADCVSGIFPMPNPISAADGCSATTTKACSTATAGRNSPGKPSAKKSKNSKDPIKKQPNNLQRKGNRT